MTAVVGHLMHSDFEDAFRNWSSCEPFALFDAPVRTYVPTNNADIQKNLHDEAKRSDMLMIWTDCDREGEHIGKEIVTVCRRAKPNIIVKRARFSAIIPQYVSIASPVRPTLTSSQTNTPSCAEPGRAGPRASGRSGSSDNARPEDRSGFHSSADVGPEERGRSGQRLSRCVLR